MSAVKEVYLRTALHCWQLNRGITYRAIWRTCTNFVPCAVPAHLKDTTSTPVAVHQGSSLKQQDSLMNPTPKTRASEYVVAGTS